MKTHRALSDEEFEYQFQHITLNPRLFSHEAHLRLAWIHIRKYGPRQAVENVTQQIKAFAAKHGDPGKYHHTVTIAAVRTVYHFMLKSNEQTFMEFIKKYPVLKHDFKQLLNAHYKNVFASPEARVEYVAPDLLAYDELP